MRRASIERDADPLVAAPDRAAAADELIGFDHQHERRWQAEGVCDLDRRTARRQVTHGAFDAIAAERDGGALQDLVTRRRSLLDPKVGHGRDPHSAALFAKPTTE